MIHTYRSWMAIQVKHMPIHVRYIQVLHGGFQVEALFHVGVQAGVLLICAHVRTCAHVRWSAKGAKRVVKFMCFMCRVCAMCFMCRMRGECFMWNMWGLTRQQLVSCVICHAWCVLCPAAVVAGRGKTGTRRNEEHQETRNGEHQERQYLPEKDKNFVGEDLLDRQARRRWPFQNLYLHPHIHLESSTTSESSKQARRGK